MGERARLDYDSDKQTIPEYPCGDTILHCLISHPQHEKLELRNREYRSGKEPEPIRPTRSVQALLGWTDGWIAGSNLRPSQGNDDQFFRSIIFYPAPHYHLQSHFNCDMQTRGACEKQCNNWTLKASELCSSPCNEEWRVRAYLIVIRLSVFWP